MTAKELQNSAIPSFQKFCEMNGVKPTNMKADYFLAGYCQGLNNASKEMFCFTPEELPELLRENHTIKEKVLEKLINIANGYRVQWKYNAYDIKKVYFITPDEQHTAVMVLFELPTFGYRLEHLCDVAIVPF